MKPITLTTSAIRSLVRVLCLSAAAMVGQAQELIFESAKVGPTNQYGTGLDIGPDQYFGVRFHLPQDTVITGVGGHIWVENFVWAGVFDAFIVRLPNEAALPEGDPFTEDEVVASVVCTPTDLLSRDYIFPVNANLPAGHYALVFGGGIYANSRLPGNDEAVRHPSYLVWGSDGWRDYPHGGRKGRRALPDYRLTLYGIPLR
jgi:hypothetical protein